MYLKFSKSSKDVMAYKSGMIEQNSILLEQAQELAKVYGAQPKRLLCKNCEFKLKDECEFSKMGIGYKVCASCGHLNGEYEDTDAFHTMLYTENKGEAYAADYLEKTAEDFKRRVADVYLPKTQFLKEVLIREKKSPKDLSYADFGAGSGYFISALKEEGLHAVGYEVSETLIQKAELLCPGIIMHHHEIKDIIDVARATDAEVVSMVGVLEHLQEPRKMMSVLRNNLKVQYVYISVPLYSPSVFVELASPWMAPRHLTGGHTHLYTEESFEHLCEEYGLRIVGEWWFGMDGIDLYRSLLSNGGEECEKMIRPLIDPIQSAIDQQKRSSEVHMVLSFIR